jgi:hypothetical protein
MKIVIKNNKTLDADISFDFYGNLYFSYNNITYQVNVNGKNILYLEPGEYKIIEHEEIINKTEIKPVKNINGSNSLRELALKENCIRDELYPEDDEYIDEENLCNSDEIIDEDIETKYGAHNKRFKFFNTTPDSSENSSENNLMDIVHLREDGEVCALYDTYIYNNEMLYFKTNSSDDLSYYRIRVYLNGDIYFRPIGYSDKLYILTVNDNNMLYISLV